MKQVIPLTILSFTLAVMSSQIAQAQGTLYVSTLGLTSAGSSSVGNDSWVAADFGTGTNAGGYLLNTVQLALGDASGNPSSFTAMVYSRGQFPGTPNIGSSLGTLNGSLDPVTAGIYSYGPASNLTLLPSTMYFIVVTGGTPLASGAYKWSYTSTFGPSLSDGWDGSGVFLSSRDGLSWRAFTGAYAQFAIYATAVPEPSALALLTLGGFLLVWHRRKAKAVDTTSRKRRPLLSWTWGFP